MPTMSSTLSMPLSARVTWSDFSDEKQIAPPSPSVSSLPSRRRSLSLAVTMAIFRAGVLECLEDGRGAQQLGLVHHHFAIVVAVVVKVAADAVHDRRYTGDDGNIVRVGETRDDAMGAQIAALLLDRPSSSTALHRPRPPVRCNPVRSRRYRPRHTGRSASDNRVH